jgi:hypothetical protein
MSRARRTYGGEHVYTYNYYVSGHYPSSCFYLKHIKFWRLDFVFDFKWNLLSWAQSIELVPVSGHQHQHQHKIGYINQAQTKPSARVKTHISSSITHEA